jgi:hypothetical protein
MTPVIRDLLCNDGSRTGVSGEVYRCCRALPRGATANSAVVRGVEGASDIGAFGVDLDPAPVLAVLGPTAGVAQDLRPLLAEVGTVGEVHVQRAYAHRNEVQEFRPQPDCARSVDVADHRDDDKAIGHAYGDPAGTVGRTGLPWGRYRAFIKQAQLSTSPVTTCCVGPSPGFWGDHLWIAHHMAG